MGADAVFPSLPAVFINKLKKIFCKEHNIGIKVSPWAILNSQKRGGKIKLLSAIILLLKWFEDKTLMYIFERLN